MLAFAHDHAHGCCDELGKKRGVLSVGRLHVGQRREVVLARRQPTKQELAIGAGSLFFSHVNDAGFWLVKEYFGLTVGETIKSWSVMETVISVFGFNVLYHTLGKASRMCRCLLTTK